MGQTRGVLVRDVGPRALLVEVDDAVAAAGLAGWLRSRRDLAAADVVPAACTVLLDGVDPEAARAVLRSAPDPGADPATTPATEVEITVTYDGEDLAAVAQAWGTDVAGVVAEHTATVWTSAFCGFAPGFAYLAGLPASRAVPRLDEPRARLAPGSVALADRWCGVYPSTSPGGWRVVGHTDAVLWDVTRAAPALLAPGTRVRFRSAPS